jgi:7-cyano-7-deazaguanine synthase in queuosine biosynthesis
MNQYTVVVNDCAPTAATGGPISIRTRETPHGARNFLLNYSNLAAGLPRQLSHRELDWIDTIGNLFALDLACGRGQGDVDWARSIVAHVPVRDPTYWRGVAPRIQAIFSDFTADRLELNFEADQTPASPPRQRRSPFPDHDCVSLLSGGVDSFVGTASLLEDGLRPLMVSHTAAGSISHAQSEAEQSLRTRRSNLERVGLTAKKYGPTFPQPEPSQRCRSFLFLAAAALIAAVGESQSVFINENGIMAIHVPMTVARIGSLSTHTAAPVVLERIESLASDVLEAPVTIRNCLISLTKPEVVGRGVVLGLEDDLQRTVSCWSIGRTGEHCGVCAPCLMRRISFELNEVDDATYKHDAFGDTGILDAPFACDNLAHLVRLIEALGTSADVALQIEFPELLNGGSQLSLADTIAMHHRWSDQAGQVLFDRPVPASLR